jgi:menaquinol-cytochrome c reductase iron-sulfur subunit
MDQHDHSPPRPDRRNYLVKAAAVVIGGILAAVPPLAGVFVFLDPMRRKSGARDFVRVGSIAGLPENGEPRKLPVLATQVDAWNKTQNVPVGAVYVQKTEPDGVRVLNVVCPHLGCAVGYSASANHFFCPCHKSSFSIDGNILDPRSPSPRGMDELEAVVRPNGEIWVRFQNFRKGTPDKIPV